MSNPIDQIDAMLADALGPVLGDNIQEWAKRQAEIVRIRHPATLRALKVACEGLKQAHADVFHANLNGAELDGIENGLEQALARVAQELEAAQ